MKILYLSWGYEDDQYIAEEFIEQGIETKYLSMPLELWKKDYLCKESFYERKSLNDILSEEEDIHDDIVFFSIDFNQEISMYCQSKKIPYCSWVLNFPNYDLYTEAVYNECNYIGIADTHLVENLLKLGIKKVFYLPNAIQERKQELLEYKEREICFFNKNNTNTLNLDNMSIYNRGYLDAVIHSQRVNPNTYLLDNSLIKRVYDELNYYNPIDMSILPYFEKQYIADYYLSPYCKIQLEQIFLQNNQNILTIYSDYNYEMCECKKLSYIEKSQERDRIYKNKEFTLVLGNFDTHHGITKEILEIIAAGGLPICYYKKDMDLLFKNYVNILYFKNNDDFKKIIKRYGNDKEERMTLVKNSFNYVMNNHTYKNRIEYMLEVWKNI